jgi:hypothetical protein
MTIRPWPEDDKPADFEEITEPFIRAMEFAFDLRRHNLSLDIPYDGFDIGEDTAANSMRATELLKYPMEDDPLHAIIRLALQVGIEQGRRIAVTGPPWSRTAYMPATDVVEALTAYLDTVDMTTAPETLMGLLKSAAKHLFSGSGESFKPEILPSDIKPTIVQDVETVEEPGAAALPAYDETMVERVKRRPANYAELSPQEQWMVDKELGILDNSPDQ